MSDTVEIKVTKLILECPACEKEFDATNSLDVFDEVCPHCKFTYYTHEHLLEDRTHD